VQYSCSTRKILYCSCIVVVLHLCGPLKGGCVCRGLLQQVLFCPCSMVSYLSHFICVMYCDWLVLWAVSIKVESGSLRQLLSFDPRRKYCGRYDHWLSSLSTYTYAHKSVKGHFIIFNCGKVIEFSGWPCGHFSRSQNVCRTKDASRLYCTAVEQRN